MANDKYILDTAVIMAGGQGTRLQQITGPLPKSMVNIRGTQNQYYGLAKDTILEHQIDVLSQNGINNFILVVGNKKEFIKSAFTNDIINQSVYTHTPYDRKINIQFFEEQSPLGTGGSFCSKELQDLIQHKDFLFTYSDVLFDVNIQSMYNFHKRNQANATVLVSPCKNPDDRPLCVFDKYSSAIVSMIPKQGKEDGPRGGIFPNTPKNGLIILSNSFFRVLPEDPVYLDFEESILMRLIYDSNFKVVGWKTPCYIKDIGVVSRYYEGVEELSKNIPASKNPNKFEQTCVILKESDLLLRDKTGKITISKDVAFSISQLNSRGIITVLEKDISKSLNCEKENELIDTLLIRSQTPSFLNKQITDISEIKVLAEEWNMPPNHIFYVSKQTIKDGTEVWSYSSLEENSQPQIAPNILSATNNIIYQNLNYQTQLKEELPEQSDALQSIILQIYENALKNQEPNEQ